MSVAPLPGWILEIVVCPQEGCAGRLAATPMRGGAGVLRCGRCEMMYPVVAGVPVPAPAHYVAAYREAILASLVEAGAATTGAVEIVDGFAAAGRGAEASRFGDDWIEGEAALPPGAVGEALAGLLAAPGPEAVLDGMIAGELGTVLDVGCGDGALAARLRRRAARVIAADVSLRARDGHRDHRNRRIVITRIGRWRSERSDADGGGLLGGGGGVLRAAA